MNPHMGSGGGSPGGLGARPAEGVIQFEAVHQTRPLEEHVYGETARELAAWREVMTRLGLLGQHPERYEGLGYGNVSARLGPMGNMTQGRRRFLITGTQTGGRRMVSLEDFCVVERHDLAANRVVSFGPVEPSSEALTHGAIYDAAPAARAVLHGHSPEIWRHARALRLPVTGAHALNGTPEMAREVTRLIRESAAAELGILVMGGHPDGVLTFGRSAAEAGGALVRHLARACALG
ncbi:MAG TPA: class II aldolase/adducin family protein [Candidatus Saccharimonadales bacterium]|nr:class II aldolase/adducin family protein [Candidatus Saccharimonadales bacterium]